ncbi:NF-kappa-B inhibitor epsilon [Gastrophryne carolinensis]
MSGEWAGKKLLAEEGRYDSGIADSVPSLQDDTIPRIPGTSRLGSSHLSISSDKLCEDSERIDSSYGSSSITESLPHSCLPPADHREAPPIPSTDLIQPERVILTGRALPAGDPAHIPAGDPAHIPAETPGTQLPHSLTFLSEEGDTLLQLSIIHHIPQLSLYFISLAPTEVLDIQNDLNQSALHLAVYLEQLEVVEALVGKGCNLELQDRKGDTPLHLACENQHLDCARALLRGPRGPQNMQLQNWKGLSCLHVATLKRNRALISLLLESGADINSQEGTSGKSALHMAVEMLDAPLLTHLLQYRPHVDALMYNGCTPLHLAVGRKDVGLARILCQAGADILQRNREGDTPQDLAEGNNQLLALLPFDDLMISGKPVVTSA